MLWVVFLVLCLQEHNPMPHKQPPAWWLVTPPGDNPRAVQGHKGKCCHRLDTHPSCCRPLSALNLGPTWALGPRLQWGGDSIFSFNMFHSATSTQVAVRQATVLFAGFSAHTGLDAQIYIKKNPNKPKEAAFCFSSKLKSVLVMCKVFDVWLAVF